MRQPQNGWLLAWFAGYVVAVGVLFLGLPRLLSQPYFVPWNYWWAFLIVTPAAAVAALGLGVRVGRFSGRAVGLFYLAAVALGLGLGWLSFQLAGVV